MLKATFTYSTISPESAEQGDFEDYGFVLDGVEYPLNEHNSKDDFTQEYSLRDFVQECQSLGINYCEGSDWLYSGNQGSPYEVGEIEYAAHIEGVTPSTKNRIKRLVCGGKNA